MQNDKNELQRLIAVVKKYAVFRGYVVTDEDITDKLGISKEDLHAYESGERAIPGGIVDALKSAYNIQIKQIQHTVERPLYFPEDDEDDDVKQESEM